ncbi:hypothetical protein L5F24_07175 [Aliarcobacter butzleri]|uniref:phosphoribosyltransferase-like protein n=1 Tax=Aliarcobacter butzleri TaxID=28197 RepID=UPI001EDC7DF7|nr:hypothetical protein [Aliarcobacter butzleri]MCG3667783.1 hypothetical protein [Aliarcobacter butzleri]
MKDNLAASLLSSAMEWDTEDIKNDLIYLQTMAKFKYDSYQNYYPGRKFIESLALWVNQFQKKDRKLALDFIIDKLIFFSNEQIFQFISVSYPMFVQTYILNNFKLNNIVFKYNKVNESLEYKIAKRKILFLGLSDGSKIEVFRRINNLDNEQVFVTYDLSDSKIKDLKKDLYECKIDGEEIKEEYFNSIYLIDDFSASGLSFLRYDKKSNTFKGKIQKILKIILDNSLVDPKKVNDINIILYISTEKAKSNIIQNFSKLKEIDKFYEKINLHLNVVQMIPNESIYSLNSNKTFIEFLEKESNSDWLTKHSEVGSTKNPFLGFDECGLPVVLNHNTPNNSLPIIWFGGKNKQAVFDRISRHKEN